MLEFLIAVAGFFAIMQGQRAYKNIKRKLNTVNTYAIVNAGANKGFRVRGASIEDDAKIQAYPHKNLECMTWQLIKLEGDVHLVKNLYTHKTFQPCEAPRAGVGLRQRPLEANKLQYWEFIKQNDDTYQIRLAGTELYATLSQSEIILSPLNGTDMQKWKLILQHPIA